jgi:hypothetical protein
VESRTASLLGNRNPGHYFPETEVWAGALPQPPTRRASSACLFRNDVCFLKRTDQTEHLVLQGLEGICCERCGFLLEAVVAHLWVRTLLRLHASCEACNGCNTKICDTPDGAPPLAPPHLLSPRRCPGITIHRLCPAPLGYHPVETTPAPCFLGRDPEGNPLGRGPWVSWVSDLRSPEPAENGLFSALQQQTEKRLRGLKLGAGRTLLSPVTVKVCGHAAAVTLGNGPGIALATPPRLTAAVAGQPRAHHHAVLRGAGTAGARAAAARGAAATG